MPEAGKKWHDFMIDVGKPLKEFGIEVKRKQANTGFADPKLKDWPHSTGSLGCLLSHHEILESFLLTSGPRDRLLILEDDAYLVDGWQEILPKALKPISPKGEVNTATMVYLGGFFIIGESTVDPSWHCTPPQGTHAYLVNRGGATHLKDALEAAYFSMNSETKQIDGIYQDYAPEAFSWRYIMCPSRWIFGQRGGVSTLSGRMMPKRTGPHPEQFIEEQRNHTANKLPSLLLTGDCPHISSLLIESGYLDDVCEIYHEQQLNTTEQARFDAGECNKSAGFHLSSDIDISDAKSRFKGNCRHIHFGEYDCGDRSTLHVEDVTELNLSRIRNYLRLPHSNLNVMLGRWYYWYEILLDETTITKERVERLAQSK
jgi:hypothetical protein